jgi:hypothetical protein
VTIGWLEALFNKFDDLENECIALFNMAGYVA